ncbi:unnamed protein product [Sordaria macrospora k-hell]|uniref:WGS project CABT00000000 data, contig 2.17 n=1 Tax=Sordaria macrospora (strain ATCC MYA-333 / DSM 997 / K(L3346) / K-hell) TaxID=771870 RepID=F7W0P9_SORMK|nr:uncharacterized protein SMAC_04053 [Sordaria macrospora k-hell]KAH7633392.1 hypothetical protein B0T09DRAFT_258131 [Sordaria sp. MPI-SDFR-AT-0083]CCC11350.1 unnamed protein product [Sordaria macrospora k-hell]
MVTASFKPVDTLDSSPQATGPPFKKQKTGSETGRSVTVTNEYSNSHVALSPELIEDAPSDYAARTNRSGSHGSRTSLKLQTEGVIEFQNVQDLGLRDGGTRRSNRRRRSHGGSQSPGTNTPRYGPSIEPGRDDIDNSDRDELGEKSPHFSSGPLPRRANSTRRMVDAADSAILGSPEKRPKRLRRQLDPEEDELALGTPPNSRNPRRAASSLVNKGGIQTTERNNSQDLVKKARVIVRLESALCQPNHRYIRKGPQGWCSLGEVVPTGAKHLQLCACSTEGNLLSELDWLEITKRVNAILHNPKSSFVKICQSTTVNVGANMVFQFFTAEEAQIFVQWAKENLSAKQVPVPQHDQQSSGSQNDDTLMIDAPPVSSPPVSRWTEDHPEWSKDWRVPLVFHRTIVDKDDIPRLDENQCLNDNLLGFGLHYLFEEYPERHSELRKRVYVHNTFFYEKLKATKSRDINYDGVKGWTSKVDLLSYDYIVVPVNEYYHWWVAIICNPGRLDPNHPQRSTNPTREASNSKTIEGKVDGNVEKPDDVEMVDIDNVQSRDQGQEIQAKESRKSAERVEIDSSNKAEKVKNAVVDLVAEDTDNDLGEKLNKIAKPPKKDISEETKILTLDSLGNTHYPAVQSLKKYLLAEFEDKRQTKIEDPRKQIGIKASNIPEQDNFSDCGVYLLGYIQEFVKDPDQFAHCLLRRDKPDWRFDPSELREYWRNTIFEKQKEYQARHDEEKRRKKEEAARRKAASSTPSDTAMSATERQVSERNGLSHDSTADNASSAPQFVKPPVVSRNTTLNVPTPAPRPTTAIKSPPTGGASPSTVTVTNPAAVAVGRGDSNGHILDPVAPIPRPSTRPQKTAGNVVVDLEQEESELKDEVPDLLPGENHRPRSKDHNHSPRQPVSSQTPKGSPELNFIPTLPSSSPASDRRTSGIALEISPQTFYSNVPQRPQSPKLQSLKPYSPRPQSPLVERKRKSSPVRRAKATSTARKMAPSLEPKAQPAAPIDVFDPPTPEVQRPMTTTSKAKVEKKIDDKVDGKDKNNNNQVNHNNKTTYGKSDKLTRQKSRIPRRVVDNTGGSGSGIGKGRRAEQQRQPSPTKTTSKEKAKSERKAETKTTEEIPDSPPPAIVVSDIPALHSAAIDLTDDN